jgi:16S rRNA (adenine1518-N6/adenine1519-N6)-dimethyltransferase
MKLELPKANKSLGQHFLRDQNVISKICNDFKGEAQGILEIGPGPGILTESLAARAKEENLPFFVIEKDERFPEYLRQFISDDQITLTDALAVNLSEFLVEKKMQDKNVWLVSNLPYNISTPLLINFLQAPEIKMLTLMFQKEVADKVFAFSSSKNFMGSLMALSQAYFDCELLCKVPPGAFAPPPKVDSAVLTMTRRETPHVPLSEFRTFEKFLRVLFSQKRKQLGGVLKSAYPIELITESFAKINVPLTIRSEALTFEQVIELYRMLKK